MLELIIVRYGLREYEVECVQQVMEMAQEPYHLTVYDNYPKDENLSVVWNRLISRTDADMICLLNNDTVVQKGWDTKLLSTFERTDMIVRDDDAFLDRSTRHPDRLPYYSLEKFKALHEYLAGEGLIHSIGIVAGGIKNHPDMKEYILSAKHEYEFCSHSLEHKDYAEMSKKEQEEDIKKSVDIIENEFGIRVHKLYAPYNSINRDLQDVCKKLKIELSRSFAPPQVILSGEKAKYINIHYWDTDGVEDLKKLVKTFPKQIGAVGPISNHAGGHQGGFSKKCEDKITQACGMLSGFCVMFPKRVWKELGGFDERFHLYGEDSDFFRRMSKKWPLITRYDTFVYHHGAQSTRIAEERGKNMDEIRKKASDKFLEKKV